MAVRVMAGDSRDMLKQIADASIDAVVTDPPYSLVSIVKRFGKSRLDDGTKTTERIKQRADGHARTAAGFMGQTWDNGEVVHDPSFWSDVLRVMKPGAHLVAFGGTRTYHRMACAIEDAGFEIRDTLCWLYGTGFPKSHNLEKHLPEWQGWGTALKPAFEPIVLARKPLVHTVAGNVLEYGTGALNIDACRVEGDNPSIERRETARRSGHTPGTPGRYGDTITNRITAAAYIAPHDGEQLGRWPANLVHDGSDEVVGMFPASAGQQGNVKGSEPSKPAKNVYGEYKRVPFNKRDGDSAARFFYSVKAGKEDRWGTKHPTVKPIALMRWLCRLVTPPGGIILDPFAGSGTTGIAALQEGFDCTLIERETNYVADINNRLKHFADQAPLLHRDFQDEVVPSNGVSGR